MTAFKRKLKLFMDPLREYFELLKEYNYDLIFLITQFFDYYFNPNSNINKYNGGSELIKELKENLEQLNIPIKEIDIDISDFNNWLIEFSEILDIYRPMKNVCIEKCLEHYITYKYLNVTRDDILIDIAASGSNYADILADKGIKTYKLDLSYPVGILGNKIGADAGNTNLPDNFASVLTSHCAYECFMGDADSRFIKEAARILDKNGRFGIVPLYISNCAMNTTSPYCNQKKFIKDFEAIKLWRRDKYKVIFSRIYSPKIFFNRIYSALPNNLKGEIFYFKNLSELSKKYPKQSLYCHFMFYGEKI